MSPLILVIRRRIRTISSSAGVASARAHSSTPSMVAASRSRVRSRSCRYACRSGRNATLVRKWSHPAQRNRNGHAPPPAWTLEGLAAGAVWHGDFPDRVPGMFGVQQGAGVAPDTIAVPVEAERGDLVDGVAAAVFADPVVAAGHRVAPVIEEFGQHIDGDTGVGVPLGARYLYLILKSAW